MYVQPLYTRRDGESTFPILRFVLVSYEGRVGIGETLREAIEDSLDGVVARRTEPGRRPRPRRPAPRRPSRRPRRPRPRPGAARRRRSAELLQQAEDKFTEADAAQQAGNTVKWARLMEEGRDLIEEAVRLAG